MILSASLMILKSCGGFFLFACLFIYFLSDGQGGKQSLLISDHKEIMKFELLQLVSHCRAYEGASEL